MLQLQRGAARRCRCPTSCATSCRRCGARRWCSRRARRRRQSERAQRMRRAGARPGDERAAQGLAGAAQGVPDAAAAADEGPERGHDADRLARGGAEGVLRQAAAGARRVAQGPAACASSTTTCCVKQLEAIFATPVPTADDAACAACRCCRCCTTRSSRQLHAPRRRKQIGLVDESAVDWDGEVDIDRSAASAEPDRSRDGRHRRSTACRRARAGSEPTRGAAADRPRAARLRLPDAPEGRVAEGAPRARQPGPHASSSSRAASKHQRDDLDDLRACWRACARPAACARSRAPT